MPKLSTANHDLPPGKREHFVWDDEIKGFGLRIRRGSGDRIMRNWIIQYRASGHGRRMVIGDVAKITAAQARAKARKLHAAVELGGDPSGDRRERRDKDDRTLRAVTLDFLAFKRTTAPDIKRFEQYLLGPIGKRAVEAGTKPYLHPLHRVPVDKITRKDIAARLVKVSIDHGMQTAKMLRSTVSTMFSWAMQMGLVEANPIIGTVKLETKPRDRVLTNDELAAIWKALPDNDYGKVIRLLILTGCRASEIAGMKWSEFDDKGTWTLPAGRTKNRRPHTLPVTGMMQEVLDSVFVRNGVEALFGRKGFTSFVVGKHELDAKLDLPKWVHHDIRRSVATGMANLGVQPHVIEAALNHQSGSKRGVAGIYNRSSYEREVAQAMALWADHVAALISGERKVLAFGSVHNRA
jgi:integrase